MTGETRVGQVSGPVVREADMVARLCRRYRAVRSGTDARRYAVAAHVPLVGPGFMPDAPSERVADFIAQDTYREWVLPDGSKGGYEWSAGGYSYHGQARQQLHGHEIKVSRSDWLAELRDPSKAEAWAQYCDRWWLVVSSLDIVRDDLPAGWGLMVADGTGSVRVKVRAPLRDPEPMPTYVRAQLMRAVQKTAANPGGAWCLSV